MIDNSPKKQEDILVEKENVEEVESNTPEMEIPSIKLLDDSKKIESENETGNSDRFYSPLVKSIAKKENISLKELDQISGSGKDGRVTKQDILNYLKGDARKAFKMLKFKPLYSFNDLVKEKGVKIKIFGSRKNLPHKILEIFQNIEESSLNNKNLVESEKFKSLQSKFTNLNTSSLKKS